MDILAIFRHELGRILTLKPAFSVLIGAVLIYAVLYPQPYLNEALRKTPIVVVDRDGTTTSRELVRRIDATPDVAIAATLPDFAAAQRAIFTRDAFGVLLIPQNFERDLLHGRASPVALYADASYFLVYQRVSGGVTAAARQLGTEVEIQRLVDIGIDPAVAATAADPVQITPVPLFNPQGGYATYVLPAAFVLILQQTLLIGTGLLGTLPDKRTTPEQAGPVATVLGKAFAYLALEAVVVPFYLVGLPYLYGVPRLGAVATVLVVAIPFVLAVGCLGMIAAALFRSPLAVQLATAAIGLPFFFLSGFAWPAESMPEAVRLLSVLLPSTSAIDGIVRVSQLGAPLSTVRDQFLTLWALAFVYGTIAVLLELGKRRKSKLVGAQPAVSA